VIRALAQSSCSIFAGHSAHGYGYVFPTRTDGAAISTSRQRGWRSRPGCLRDLGFLQRTLPAQSLARLVRIFGESVVDSCGKHLRSSGRPARGGRITCFSAVVLIVIFVLFP